MNLYSKKNNKLIIYSLDTTIEKIANFKREQMLTIPEEYRVLRAETNDKSSLESCGETIAYKELEYVNIGVPGGIIYHNLKPSTQLDDIKKMILDEYYKVLGPVGRLKKITFNDNSDTQYLLLINEKYKVSFYDYSKWVMSEIINIPRILFVYERFIRGNLLDITDEELKKILDLYTLSTLETIDLKEVYKLDYYRVTEDVDSQISRKLDQSEKILSLIQK